MKLTVTQLRNIIKTEIKRLGGKGLNEAPRRADGRPGPVDDESDRARARRGRAPMPAARPKARKPVASPRVTNFDGTVGGLSTALQKFDAKLPVMFGKDGEFVPVFGLDEVGMAGSVVFAPAVGRPTTVGSFIYELSDFDDAVTIMFGKPGAFVPAREIEIIDFDEYLMQVADGEGESHVCIMPAGG